ncbi:MAG: beta-ketoacyl-[acyl-carrier-protein] synthase family protein [Nitrospirota bacterium]
MKTRVVITGIGVVSPAGIGKDEHWRNISSGNSFVSEITKFDASKYPSRIAGQINSDLEKVNTFPKRLLKKIDRFSHLALLASEFAISDAKLNLDAEDKERMGVFIGNAIGGWEFAEVELRDLYAAGLKEVSPYQATAWFPAAPQGQVSIYYGLLGYSQTIIADSASGLVSIGSAYRAIQEGEADVILAGGSEAPISPYGLLCCNTSGVLTTRNDAPQKAYKPFDKDRDGFAIGEGAGIVILENMEHAKKRGAKIYGEITGFSMTNDGIHPTKQDIEGRQLSRAIQMAIKEAGIAADEIDYICANGSATRDGDIAETKAIKAVFGKKASQLPISAPKSAIGNLLGAAGAVDTATTLLAMENSFVPPTVNLEDKDNACDLDYTALKGKGHKIKTALINSQGRGGVNAVMLIKKWKES